MMPLINPPVGPHHEVIMNPLPPKMSGAEPLVPGEMLPSLLRPRKRVSKGGGKEVLEVHNA